MNNIKLNSIIKKIVSVVAVLFIVFSFAYPVSADEVELKEVKVAYSDSGQFIVEDDEGKVVAGYTYEYLENIAYYANWKVEYVRYSSFEEAIKAVQFGEADLIYGVAYNEERADAFLFPDKPMGSESFCLFSLHNNYELIYGDKESLNGKRVGLTTAAAQNTILNQWCADNDIEFELVYYDSIPDKAEALKEGTIDLDYEINFLSDREFFMVQEIDNASFYLMANKNCQDLVDDIDTAIKKIENINPSFITNLNDKYFGNNTVSRSLSLEERGWVDNHQTMCVGYLKDFLPFSDVDENGETIGIVKDVFNSILNVLNIDDEVAVEYLGYQNDDDMYRDLNEGKLDAIFPTYGSIEKAKSNNTFFSSKVISVSADIIYKDNLTETTVTSFAVNVNNQMMDYYTKTNYPNADITYYDSINECLEAVEKGLVGATILNSYHTNSLLKNNNSDDLYYVKLAETVDLCIAVKTGNSPLLSLLNRGLANIDEATIMSFANNYINLLYSYTLSDFLKNNILIILLFFALLMIAVCLVFYYRQMNHKLLLANEEIAEKNVELEEARNAAELASKTKTKFLFNMSHDIRTPMNAIMGYTDLSLKHLDNKEEVNKNLNKIKTSSVHLLGLLNDILEMSRFETGNIVLKEEIIDIRNVVSKIEEMGSALALSEKVLFEVSMHNINNPYIYADELHLNEMIINLVSNAVKYTNEGGKVEFNVEQLPDDNKEQALYRFTVKDNGIGMSEEFQKYMYDDFAREDKKSVKKVEGSGLGLSIVKRIVEICKGHIDVYSKEGEGTTFIVEIPFKTADDSAITKMNKEKATQNDNYDFSGKKLLLVEDNEMNMEIATELLQDVGFKVETATDGNVAVESIKEKGPDYFDYVLMDIRMPKMNGYEATKKIRELFPNSDLPIIALSANAFEDDIKTSKEVGMNDHLSKPINIHDLFNVLNKYDNQ